MMRLSLFFIFFATVFVAKAQTRYTDSLEISLGSEFQGASEGFQPLWMKANRFGMASNEQADQLTWLEARNAHRLASLRLFSDTASLVELSYGARLFNAEHYSRTVLQEGFAQLKYKEWFIRGGRHRDLWDDIDPELSVGSFGISSNALPIPKVTIGIDDYINIPFTKGKLQFKGMMGHGWFGNNRFMESWLHEKSFYGRINLGKWKPYGGIQHYTEWGGQRASEDLYLDRSFSGFLDVLFVKEANDGSVPDGRRPNRAGDQRGLAEVGLHYEHEKWKLHIYHQTPFESGTGLDIRNIDRLFGVHWINKQSDGKLKNLLLEFIYTKQMESFGRESQSYYDNGAYKTGWEYEGNVVGVPLFTNRKEASNYLPIQPYDWKGTEPIQGNTNIINNRLIGGNLAASLRFTPRLSMKLKMTPVVNFGARHAERLYGDGEGLFQCYSLAGLSFRHNRWLFNASLASDFGQLYNNMGGRIGFNYQIK